MKYRANKYLFIFMLLGLWVIVVISYGLYGVDIFKGVTFNTLRPRQNGRHFPNDIFKWIFLKEIIWISIKMSLKFVPNGPINNMPWLVQIMAWRRTGDKPLSEPMMYSLLPHICVNQPQWFKGVSLRQSWLKGWLSTNKYWVWHYHIWYKERSFT